MLLRIAREMLVNVAQHAGARRVAVCIGFAQDRWCVRARDDGVGLDPAWGR